MACPTCAHTMQGVGYGIFHCPRCGTMKNADGSYTVPSLVGRVRDVTDRIEPSAMLLSETSDQYRGAMASLRNLREAATGRADQ